MQQNHPSTSQQVVEDNAPFSTNTTISDMSATVEDTSLALTKNKKNHFTTVIKSKKRKSSSLVRQRNDESKGLKHPNELPTMLRRSQRKPVYTRKIYSPDHLISTNLNKSKRTLPSSKSTTSLKESTAIVNDASNSNNNSMEEASSPYIPSVVNVSNDSIEMNGFKSESSPKKKRTVSKKARAKPITFEVNGINVGKKSTTKKRNESPVKQKNGNKPKSISHKKKNRRERYHYDMPTQTYYDNVTIGNQTYRVGDCVQLSTKRKYKKIGRINAIYTGISQPIVEGSKNQPIGSKIKSDPNLKKIIVSCYSNAEKFASSGKDRFPKHELFATRRYKVYYEDDILKKCYVLGLNHYNRIKAMKKRASFEELGQLFQTTIKPSFLFPVFNADIDFEPTNVKSKFLYFCRSIINVSNLKIIPQRFKY